MLLKTLNITNRPFQTDIHAHFLTRKVRVNSRLYYYLLPSGVEGHLETKNMNSNPYKASSKPRMDR